MYDLILLTSGKRLVSSVRPIPISPCLMCITPGTNTLGEPKQWNFDASECRTQRVSFQLAKVVKYSLDWWSGYMFFVSIHSYHLHRDLILRVHEKFLLDYKMFGYDIDTALKLGGHRPLSASDSLRP